MRTETYDDESGLLYSPVAYEYERMPLALDEMPNKEWVCEAFVTFVRGEFGTRTSSRARCPEESARPPSRTVTDVVAFEYLEQCEKDLVYGGLAQGLVQGVEDSLGAQILSLLSDPRIGNRKNQKHIDAEEFSSWVERLDDHKQRLQFILPSFPFKDQNVFRTDSGPEGLDIAEIGLLVRLHALALSMYQVHHAFGVDWTIVSDGLAYARLFGVSEESARGYRNRLLDFRNRLNLHGTITVLDLLDLAHGIASAKHGEQTFSKTMSSVRQSILTATTESQPVRNAMRVLTRGIKWNRNYKPEILKRQMSWEEIWEVIRADAASDLPVELRETWREFDDSAGKAALDYAAFNITMRYHDVYGKAFPLAMRATTHPKPSQVAIPRLGPVSPWNGVGVVVRRPQGTLSIECQELYRLQRRENIIRCQLAGMEDPFYYEVIRKPGGE